MENPKAGWGAQIKDRAFAPLRPRQTVESQNAWNLYADIAWYGVLNGIATAFLAVFAIRLGGTDAHVGLLSALPALAAIFASIPGSRLVERERKPLSVLVVAGILNRAGYLAIALVPFLLAAQRADAVIAVVALLTIPGAIANVAFTNMFGQAVKPENRARVVSIRNVLISVTSTLAALIGGKFLDYVAFPINYQLLFAFAFAASMVSAYYLTRIRLPQPADAAQAQTSQSPRGAGAFVAMLRANRSFMRFTFASVIFHGTLFFSVPLYSIFWVRHLDASEGWIGLFSMVGSATTIVFYPLWGRMTARRGNHPAMVLSTVGLVLYPLFTALAPNLEWILFVSFVGGVFSSGFALSFFNGLLDVCPEQNRASHIAAYNTLINLAAFLSPVIATSLTTVIEIRALLFIGAAIRLVGAFLIWRSAPRRGA
jgi:MFS family permease